jgi:hypothetical protein
MQCTICTAMSGCVADGEHSHDVLQVAGRLPQRNMPRCWA